MTDDPIADPIDDLDLSSEAQRIREKLNDTAGDPILRLVGQSILLLVEAVVRLNTNLDANTNKSAAAIDYISDHLHAIGVR